MSGPEHEQEPVEHTELPEDRTLALQEINTLAESLRRQNLHVYTTRAFRRDRYIGWTIACVIFALLFWAIFYQYATVNALRQSAYQSCQERNQASVEQRRLYRELASEIPDKRTSRLIAASASQIDVVNCQQYLH